MEKTVGAVNSLCACRQHRLKMISLKVIFTACILVLLSSPGLGQSLQLDPSRILGQAAPKQMDPEPPAEPIFQGYLYLEPNQMRFEALFDAQTALNWAQLPSTQFLNADEQKALTDALAAKAADWCRLGIEKAGEASFRGASIIKGKPGATLPLEEGATVPLREAMVGLMWEAPLPPMPEQVLIEWTGYIHDQKRLPIRVFYGSQSETTEAIQGLKEVRWRSRGRLPMPAPLASVPKLEQSAPWRLPVASLIWFSCGLVFFLLFKGRRLPGGTVAFLGAWLLGALLTWPLFVIEITGNARVPDIKTAHDAESILTPLLRNVYRAFDHRTESDIYDTLARSVDGELLRQLYLETLQALTLEGREGTRVTITEFSTEVMDVKPNPDGSGFIAHCQWTALGTVGHWGHAHTRVNRYTAQVVISPVQSEWKVTKLDVSEARRI